jgi:tetratricopeptide (TPR) repeat protein
MKNPQSTVIKQLTATEALNLIEEARNAELCRDTTASRRILSAVWQNPESETDPEISHLPPPLQAEILRLCGFHLSDVGRSRNLKNFQERGKNLITRAVEIFSAENLEVKAAEARVMLALCYCYEGSVAESEMILDETEREYADDQRHEVYIQIQVNRLMIHYKKDEFVPALGIIERLKTSVELCPDLRLVTMYHNQAGIIFCKLGQNQRAMFHLGTAISIAKRAGNTRFVAINLNNLGEVCKDAGDYAQAHLYVDESAKHFRKMNEPGWLAQALDTKAQIYLAQHNAEAALGVIDEALVIFRGGEDYACLVYSLFTKCRVLLQLNNTIDALVLFGELTGIARERIGEFAVKQYAEELAKIIYVYRDLSFPQEVRHFKTEFLAKQLRAADLQVTRAAENLGISHQNLSDILNNQVPELFKILGMKRRAKRGTKKQSGAKNVAISARRNSVFEGKITPVNIRPNEMIIAGEGGSNGSGGFDPNQFKHYVFGMEGGMLSPSPVDGDVLVLVEQAEKKDKIIGSIVILQHRRSRVFQCGILGWDSDLKIYFFQDTSVEDGFPTGIDDYRLYGKIIGVCRLDDTDENKVIFQPFPFVSTKARQ